MTVKLSDIKVSPKSEKNYCTGTGDLLATLTVAKELDIKLAVKGAQRIIVSAVRFVMREGYYEMNMVPAVLEMRRTPGLVLNEFGHNIFVTVQYNSNGWLSTLGGSFNRDTGRYDWQVYMD